MQLVVARISSLGYSCGSVTIRLADWNDVSRDRLFLFGRSQENGGAVAAKWIYQTVNMIIMQRKAAPPTSALDIIPRDDILECRRRRSTMACFLQIVSVASEFVFLEIS